MTRHHRLRLLVPVLVAALLSGGPALARSAPEAPETGVWWQLQREGGGLAPPAVLVDIPEDGLWLNSGPSGDQAISAVRYDVPRDAVAERFTLRVHEDSSTPEPVMALCPPAEPWQPPEQRPGAWDQRPVPDCEQQLVNGVVAEDGQTVEFSLVGYEAGEDVDLVLTRFPGDDDTYLSVTFEAPTVVDLELRRTVSGGGFVAPASDDTGPPTTSTAQDRNVATPLATPPPPASRSNVVGGTDRPASASPSTTVATPEPTPVDITSREPNQEMAAETIVTVEEGTSAAKAVASVLLIGLLGWIGLIVAQQVRSGRGSARPPSFTLYKGAPPAR